VVSVWFPGRNLTTQINKLHMKGGLILGTIIRASCECGFQSSEIYAGGGFMSGSTCNVPAFCPKCKEMVVANYSKKAVRCPECHGKLVFYDDPSLREAHADIIFDWGGSGIDDRWASYLYNTNYLCPKCGRMKMRFSDVGMWD
jgi:ribosomal protein L37AE/L43A